MKRKNLPEIQTASVCIPIPELAGASISRPFLRSGSYTVEIDYPFESIHSFVVKGPMSSMDLALAVGKEYKRIYSKPNCDFWGHGIEDLFLASMRVNHQKRKVTLEVGS